MKRRLAFRMGTLRALKRPRMLERDTAGARTHGGYISPATRRLVWRRDGGKCRRCGSTHELQFDHIVPKSRGGAGCAANVELLCKRCNLSKRASVAVPHD
jgi:5-methylcytosine-specific restriction endonuclease McrA